MKNVRFSFIFIFMILLISLVFAYNINLDINSDLNDFNTDVYKCSDLECIEIQEHSLINTGTNTNSYSLVDLENGDDYYVEYDYKTCYKPFIFINHVWGDETGDYSFNLDFNKKQDCRADINDLEVSADEVFVGETIQISTKVHSAFEYPDDIPETAIPNNIEEEYSSNTKVQLYVNDELIDEQEKEILLANDEGFEFKWTPESSGDYKIKIKTQVVDCSCSSQNTQTSIVNVQVNEPKKTYYKDLDNDGYSDGITQEASSKPLGYKLSSDLIATSGDCNDNDENINPRAEEICDGIDNDCDGEIDEGDVCVVLPACIDGIDNDEDGLFDMNDPGCSGFDDDDEIDCYENINCGNDTCASENFCLSGDVYQNFVIFLCNNAGLNNAFCSSGIEPVLLEKCLFGCEDGECLNQCSEDIQCGEETTELFCEGDDLKQETITPFCSQGSCDENIFYDLVEVCEFGCSNKECNDEPPECEIDSDCGEESYSKDFCSSGDVYKNHIIPKCTQAKCDIEIIKKLVEECDEDCENGECVEEEDDNRGHRKRNQCCYDRGCEDTYYTYQECDIEFGEYDENAETSSYYNFNANSNSDGNFDIASLGQETVGITQESKSKSKSPVFLFFLIGGFVLLILIIIVLVIKGIS